MGGFWENEPRIQNDLTIVSSLIDNAIEHAHPFVKGLLTSQLETRGKLLRPALVMIGARLGNQERKNEALRIASVLEMIHMASLIHDDIIDNAGTRRGVPTLHARVGAKQAVLAGDYLLSRAMSLIGGEEGDLEASAVANAFSRLCESELEQDAGYGDFSISTVTYLRRIAGKTASLFALSAYAGAAVTQAPVCLQRRLHRIGYNMGMAFQIQDDILDYNGNPDKLGKETGRDLSSGIPTLPLLEALANERSLAVEQRALHTLIHKQKLTNRNISRAIILTRELQGIEKAKAISNSYAKRAHRDIQKLGNEEVSYLLLDMFNRLSKRTT